MVSPAASTPSPPPRPPPRGGPSPVGQPLPRSKPFPDREPPGRRGHRVRSRLCSSIRITRTCPSGIPRDSLARHLIPEGTFYVYSSHRCHGTSGSEYARPGYVPTGFVRAVVPRHCRDRRDLLPLHPRDHTICAVHRACRRDRGRLLYAKYRADACRRHSERTRSPLIPFWLKERALVDLPTYTN